MSESEREVIGLVFALAGYLVHDVHETVSFMLLDALVALDAERIAASKLWNVGRWVCDRIWSETGRFATARPD